VTLVVEDGKDRDSFTQHITVDGEKTNMPVLTINAPSDPSFHIRQPFVMDVYGGRIPFIPHTLQFVARQANLQPEPKKIYLENTGSGILDKVSFEISYKEEKD